MKAVCGLDVHKDSIFLCILHSDGELFEQVFGVLTFQLEEMRNANSTSKCKITKCFCKSTPLVLRNSISFLVSH